MSAWQTSIRDISLHTKPFSDARWNCDGSYIGTASLDKNVKIGQLELTGNIRSVHSVPCSGSIAQVCWHPLDPNRYAIVGSDKTMEVWDIRATRPTSKLTTLGNNINASWSPDGQYIALGNKSDNLVIMDMKESKLLKKAKFNYEVNEMGWGFNSDHILISTGGADMGGIDIMSFQNQDLNLVDSITAHTSNCYCLKIDPTFRRMAVGSADTLISLWDLDQMVCYKTLNAAEPSAIGSVCFSGDGEYLAAGCEGNSIVICNCSTGETMATVDCRLPPVSLSWHPTRPLLSFASDDRAVEGDDNRFRDKSNLSYLKLISFTVAS